MKLSVSLTEDDVRFLDDYARSRHVPTRSAAVSRAIGALRESQLEAAYAAALEEWDDSGEAALWDTAVGDGLIRESRRP